VNFSAPELNQIPMSPELATTLAHATDAAGQMGFPEVNLEHLLAALCDDPEALAILDSSGVDAARIRSDAIAFLSRTAGPPVADRGSLFLSEEVRRILEAATAAARGGRRRDINGAILLAAIVGDGRSLAAQMLQSHGLSFESAIKALQSSLSQPARERTMERPMLADEVLARARERVQSRAAPSLRQIMADTPLSAPPEPLPTPELTVAPQGPDPLSEPAAVEAEPSLKSSDLLETLKAETSEPTLAGVDEAIAALDTVEAATSPLDVAAPTESAPTEPSLAEEALSEPTKPEEPSEVAATALPPADAVPAAAAPAAPQPIATAFGAPSAPTNPAAKPADKPATVAKVPEPTGPRLPAFDRPATSTAPSPPSGSVAQRQSFPPLSIERPRPGPDLPPPIPPNALPPGMPPLSARAPAGPPLSAPGPTYHPAPPPGLGGTLQGGPRLPIGAPPGARPSQAMPALQGPQTPQGFQGPQPPAPQAMQGPQAQQPHASQSLPKPPVPATPAARERPPVKGDGSPLHDNIPRAMRVGTTERVEIRIARAAMKALGSGLESPHLGRRYGVGAVQAVAVRLRAPEGGFLIETASPESQWIEGQGGLSIDEFASWRFNVAPQSRGRHRLQIMTSARIVGSDGIAAETPMPDQVIEVKVRRDTKRALAKWFGWLVATAIGVALALSYEKAFESLRPFVERFTN